MTLTTEDFNYVSDVVLTDSGIVISSGKEYLVESRLLPLSRKLGYDAIEPMLLELRTSKNADVRSQIVDSMTTNETSFLRDLHPFEALRESVLPPLIEARKPTRKLRIWSAAASTGQEAYTIAIIIRQHFPDLADWDIEILGTDISDRVLAKAEEGIYSQLEVNRGLPARYLTTYFDREGTSWRVKPTIRAMVTFRKMNLIGTWPAVPTMDVVFLRNVLIYFDVDVKREILGKVQAHMSGDAMLFLGGAESPLGLDLDFERVSFEQCSCYRKPCGETCP